MFDEYLIHIGMFQINKNLNSSGIGLGYVIIEIRKKEKR